jgi:hypothetical protein
MRLHMPKFFQTGYIQIIAKWRSCIVIWKKALHFSSLPAAPSSAG